MHTGRFTTFSTTTALAIGTLVACSDNAATTPMNPSNPATAAATTDTGVTHAGPITSTTASATTGQPATTTGGAAVGTTGAVATANTGAGSTGANVTTTGAGATTTGAGTVSTSASATSTTVNATSATTGAAGTTSTTGGGTGACSMTPPPNATISDFSDWTGTNWGAAGNLTGGSFSYSGTNTTNFSYAVDMAAGNLAVTGTINDYGGLGMWFGPCTDAAAYSGIQFDISGSLGANGQLVVQVQSSENAPLDAENMRGECTASCANAQAEAPAFDAAGSTLSLVWTDFSGGSPVATLSANQILAVQFQFNCETDAACALDVRIDNLQFF